MKKTMLHYVILCALVFLLSGLASISPYAEDQPQTAKPDTVMEKTTQDSPTAEKPLQEITSIRFDVPPPLPREKPQQKIWLPVQIKNADLLCNKILKTLTVEAKKLPALGDFEGCGDPAPLLVSSIMVTAGDKAIPVEISPPATLNCKMTGRLASWLREIVQPSALGYFNKPVTKIHNVASYHCRKRYNANEGKMSEHAFANALDISSFSLADESKLSVLKYWEPEKSQDKTGEMNKTEAGGKPIPLQASGQSEPAKTETPNPPGPQNVTEPKPQEDAHKERAESAFLKKIHKGACSLFSTVLGPESNASHADHFHLDLGRNGRYQICE